MSYDPRYPTHHQESEQELLLSIQNTLDDICLNQTYSVTYGQYTPQGLLDKGRELGAKLIEYVKWFFKWLYEKTFGRQKQIKESKEKMQKASENLSKAKQEKDHNPQPPEPQNHTSHPEHKPKPRIIRDMTPEEYHKLLMQHGYTVDGGKYDPLKIYQEAVLVVEAVGRFHQRMLKGLEYDRTSLNSETLRYHATYIGKSNEYKHGAEGIYSTSSEHNRDFPHTFTDFYIFNHSLQTEHDREHHPADFERNVYTYSESKTSLNESTNRGVFQYELVTHGTPFDGHLNKRLSVPKAALLKALREKHFGAGHEGSFQVPTLENWISITKEASAKLGQLAAQFSTLDQNLAKMKNDVEAFLIKASNDHGQPGKISGRAITSFLKELSDGHANIVAPVQEVVVETNKLLFAVERHYTHGVEDTDHTSH